MAAMKCEVCREMIDLAFGLDDLTGEVKAHLDSCHECREYYQESLVLAAELLADRRFDPTADDLDHIARGVQSAIGPRANNTVLAPGHKTAPGLRWYLAAAVVLLSLGAYWSLSHLSKEFVEEQITTAADTVPEVHDLKTDGLVSDVIIADQSYQPDQNAYEMLLDEYTFGRSLVAGDELLSGLSEEELIFLEENFDIEELVL
jgi:hypothetical protein